MTPSPTLPQYLVREIFSLVLGFEFQQVPLVNPESLWHIGFTLKIADAFFPDKNSIKKTPGGMWQNIAPVPSGSGLRYVL
jgi:hypothetical protein